MLKPRQDAHSRVGHVSEHLGGVSTLRLLMSACVSQARVPSLASRFGQLSILHPSELL